MVETVAVYPAKRAPDAPLTHIEEALTDAGFRVSPASELDLAARRGADRIFLGMGPHPEGTLVRWKTKSLMPGRSRELDEIVHGILARVLGEPTRYADPAGEAP